MFNMISRFTTYLPKSPSGTTFQKLINKQKFWQKVETNATVLTSTVAGGSNCFSSFTIQLLYLVLSVRQ
jgi:hypothetical protein